MCLILSQYAKLHPFQIFNYVNENAKKFFTQIKFGVVFNAYFNQATVILTFFPFFAAAV